MTWVCRECGRDVHLFNHRWWHAWTGVPLPFYHSVVPRRKIVAILGGHGMLDAQTPQRDVKDKPRSQENLK